MAINLQISADVTVPQSTSQNTNCKGTIKAAHHSLKQRCWQDEPIHELPALVEGKQGRGWEEDVVGEAGGCDPVGEESGVPDPADEEVAGEAGGPDPVDEESGAVRPGWGGWIGGGLPRSGWGGWIGRREIGRAHV